MTEQEQYLACAELDGLHNRQNDSGGYAWFEGSRRISNWSGWPTTIGAVRDYNTRDALVAVIEKHIKPNPDLIEKFWDELDKLNNFFEEYGHVGMIWSTPAQLREALLRATNKWKES